MSNCANAAEAEDGLFNPVKVLPYVLVNLGAAFMAIINVGVVVSLYPANHNAAISIMFAQVGLFMAVNAVLRKSWLTTILGFVLVALGFAFFVQALFGGAPAFLFVVYLLGAVAVLGGIVMKLKVTE